MSKAFRKIIPKNISVPILLSVPHCGIVFPEEIKDEFKPELISSPDDTDWFVDRLYSFATSMGITMVCSYYHRWVIDLNRDPNNQPLYADGRIITGLCPTTTFLGEHLYRDERLEISAQEIARRKELYFLPYHREIKHELSRLKQKFGKVLLWDAHSIRQEVKSIQTGKFPDLILGSFDEVSASPELIELVLNILSQSKYSVFHNNPFKGGYITRHYGNPADDIHGLQLEMTKINYMDDLEENWHEERAEKMQRVLKSVFQKCIKKILV